MTIKLISEINHLTGVSSKEIVTIEGAKKNIEPCVIPSLKLI